MTSSSYCLAASTANATSFSQTLRNRLRLSIRVGFTFIRQLDCHLYFQIQRIQEYSIAMGYFIQPFYFESNILLRVVDCFLLGTPSGQVPAHTHRLSKKNWCNFDQPLTPSGLCKHYYYHFRPLSYWH